MPARIVGVVLNQFKEKLGDKFEATQNDSNKSVNVILIPDKNKDELIKLLDEQNYTCIFA